MEVDSGSGAADEAAVNRLGRGSRACPVADRRSASAVDHPPQENEVVLGKLEKVCDDCSHLKQSQLRSSFLLVAGIGGIASLLVEVSIR